MNKIVYKFLLAGDKFMPEMHLRQFGFTYIACRLFTANKERVQKKKKTKQNKKQNKKTTKTVDSRYIYKKNKQIPLSAWYGLWRFERFNMKIRFW